MTDALRGYVEKKIGKIGRYFHAEPDATVLLSVEKERQIVELTLQLNGMILRAQEETGDMYASVDLAVDKLERQIRKFKTRINRRSRRVDGEKPLVHIEPDGAMEDEDETQIVKVKRFAVKPMDPEEAVLQMNLVGHDFFVFRNSETQEVNVVYRRRSGGYGLIEPLE